MIGRNEEKVIGPGIFPEFRKAPVEQHQAFPITADITLVSVGGIQIHEIRKDKAAVRSLAKCFQRGIEQGIQPRRMVRLRNAAMGKDIGDLADGIDGSAVFRHGVQQGRFRCGHGIVVTVPRTGEGARFLTDERTGDDTGDPVRPDQFKSSLAEAVQPVQAKIPFVRGYLEDTVRRRIDDGFARAAVFLPQLLDDDRPGGMFLSQHARQSAAPDQAVDQFPGETVRHIGEISPVEHDRIAAQFPVAAQGILARAFFRSTGVSARRRLIFSDGRHKRFARAQRMGPSKAQPGQMRQRKGGQILPFFPLCRKPLHDMAQRIGPGITETIGISRAADTKRIEHQDDTAAHTVTSLPKATPDCI